VASAGNPVVAGPPAAKQWIPAQSTIVRSSLVDPVVVVGVATPQPIVVTFTAPRPWTHRPLVLGGADLRLHHPPPEHRHGGPRLDRHDHPPVHRDRRGSLLLREGACRLPQ
jgi:hypothetical protein